MSAATRPATESQAEEVYALGSNPDESARLRRQSDELRPQSADLLGRIGLEPGQSAIDLGCGPSGILDQPVGRDDLVGVHQEQGQYRPGPGAR